MIEYAIKAATKIEDFFKKIEKKIEYYLKLIYIY